MNAEELAAIHVAWIETLAADHAEGSERIGYSYAYGSMSAQYKATLKSLEAAARHDAVGLLRGGSVAGVNVKHQPRRRHA